MHKKTRVILVILSLVSSFSFASPLDFKHISGDAKWVFHADLDAFRASKMGQLVQASLPKEYQDKIDTMKQLLGSDLTQDLYGMTLYGSTGGHENAASLFYVSYDKDKLLALLALNSTYSKSSYREHTLHHWVDEKKQQDQVGTFAADNLIIIARTEDSVKNALDVLSGKQKPLTNRNRTLSEKLNNTPDNAIIVIAAEGLSELANGTPHAAVLKNSTMMTAVLAEENGNMKLRVKQEAKSDEAAVQIEQVLLDMKKYMMMGNEKCPQLHELLGQAVLIRDKKKLSLEMQYPSVKLFELFKTLEPTNVKALTGEDYSQDASNSH